MAITRGEGLLYSKKNSHSLSNSRGHLSTCRLANHHISARRVTIRYYKTHYDERGNADQYLFIVRCNRCNLEWTELWTTSKWFIRNNNYNKNNSSRATMR